MVCDLSDGVRIFKVPLSKVARVRTEAGRLQLFDTLDKANAAASSLTRRKAYRRVAEGLPSEDPHSPQPDFSRWAEKDVPLYLI